MAKKVFTDESLATLINETKAYADNAVSTKGGIPIVTASSTDGVNYTATVDGMSAFTVGMTLIIVPDTTSTNTAPKLNVNNLGAKTIRMPVAYNTSLTAAGAVEGWLLKNKPITVQWNGTYWVTSGFSRPAAQYLYGTVPVENGGTGATTAEAAREKLGIVNGWALESVTTVMPSSAAWNSITYGNGVFVAIASGGICAYSTDGVNWTECNLPNTSNWTSVTYGDGKFVAIGWSNAYSAYSIDGINWTISDMPDSINWNYVTYGNGKFVAIASNSTTSAYSSDGISWSPMTMPIYCSWSSCAYGNGKFIAVDGTSGSSIYAHSTDGINWTQGAFPVSAGWKSVAYGNGTFVVVGSSSTKTDCLTLYSRDGANWHEAVRPSDSTSWWNNVVYADNKFVAVAAASSTDKTVMYSNDGAYWIVSTMPSAIAWSKLAYGNGRYIAIVKNNNVIATSTNGIDWTHEVYYITKDGIDITAMIKSAIG